MGLINWLSDPFGSKAKAAANANLQAQMNLAAAQHVAQSQNNNESIPALQQRLGTSNGGGDVPATQPVQVEPTTQELIEDIGQPSVSDDQINDVYSPLFETLHQQTGLTQQNYESQQADLERAKQSQLKTLQENQELANEKLASEQGELTSARDSALTQAQRAYNALRQQGNARFGGGSSAGQAVGELATQSYLRNQGEVEKTYSDNLTEIIQSGKQVDLFFLQTSREIEDEFTTQSNNLRRQMNEALQAINAQRNMLESQKSQYKLDILQTAQDRINQIQQQRLAYQLELDNWKKQQDAQLTESATNLRNSLYDYTGGAFSLENPQLQSGGTLQGSGQALSMLPSSTQNDELDDLIFV